MRMDETDWQMLEVVSHRGEPIDDEAIRHVASQAEAMATKPPKNRARLCAALKAMSALARRLATRSG